MKIIRRLKKNKEFQVVFKKGRSTANRQFVVYVHEQPGQPYIRLGLSVSKKMGNAVMRNHIKRLIKENFRLFSEKLELGYDLIIISRRPVRTLTYYEFQGSLKHALRKAGIVRE